MREIEEALGKLDELTTELVSLAQFDHATIDPEPTRLAHMFQRLWQATSWPNASLHVKSDLLLFADPTGLIEILNELFSNAIEHAGDNCSVSVGALVDDTGFFCDR